MFFKKKKKLSYENINVGDYVTFRHPIFNGKNRNFAELTRHGGKHGLVFSTEILDYLSSADITVKAKVKILYPTTKTMLIIEPLFMGQEIDVALERNRDALNKWFKHPTLFNEIIAFSNVISTEPTGIKTKVILLTENEKKLDISVNELKTIELALHDKFQENDPLLLKITNFLNQIT